MSYLDCLVEPVVENCQEEEWQESHAQEVGSKDVVPGNQGILSRVDANNLFWTEHNNRAKNKPGREGIIVPEK